MATAISHIFKRRHDGHVHISIQSKLWIVLQGLSCFCMTVVVLVSFISARQSLDKDAHDQLNSLCHARILQVEDYLNVVHKQVVTYAESSGTVNAMSEFESAYVKLEQGALTPANATKLTDFYEKFTTAFNNANRSTKIAQDYLPTANATQKLQLEFIANNPKLSTYLASGEPNGPETQLDAMDSTGIDTASPPASDPILGNSRYRTVHHTYHHEFYDFTQKFKYLDLMLVDVSGNIVYTEQKTIEFGTNLTTGFMADTNLGRLYRSLSEKSMRGDYQMVDFKAYPPNMNQPCSFIGSPIYKGEKLIGFLILQFPTDALNDLMAGGEAFGEKKSHSENLANAASTEKAPSPTPTAPTAPTPSPAPPVAASSSTPSPTPTPDAEEAGNSPKVDTYLVGSDGKMRTDNWYNHRDAEDKKRFIAMIKPHFTDTTIAAIQETDTLILNLRLDTDAVYSAQAGGSSYDVSGGSSSGAADVGRKGQLRDNFFRGFAVVNAWSTLR